MHRRAPAAPGPDKVGTAIGINQSTYAIAIIDCQPAEQLRHLRGNHYLMYDVHVEYWSEGKTVKYFLPYPGAGILPWRNGTKYADGKNEIE